MFYLIAVFKNRTECFSFLNLIHSYSSHATIINTPKQLNMPCGICVKFPLQDEKYANEILRRRNFKYFYGIYKVKQTNNSINIVPINF